MDPVIIEFIEDYAHLVDNNRYVELYQNAHFELTNEQMKELNTVLAEALEIDVESMRDLFLIDETKKGIEEFLDDHKRTHAFMSLNSFAKKYMISLFGLNIPEFGAFLQKYNDEWSDIRAELGEYYWTIMKVN